MKIIVVYASSFNERCNEHKIITHETKQILKNNYKIFTTDSNAICIYTLFRRRADLLLCFEIENSEMPKRMAHTTTNRTKPTKFEQTSPTDPKK